MRERGGLSLEQERIGWAHALQATRRTLPAGWLAGALDPQLQRKGRVDAFSIKIRLVK
ncbi:hypothetical protein GCM10009715_38850 [Paeniglutamicibacter psychrophenolicus]|uniref:Uncharacterized protein n=1 Tax=Paeniglutamicibacter psychrophenolicus TaxID=257454 RepID=A0ABS4WID9_9MICC|nr:hypothetical protein [Paeniglutamicibacter psychrophenolicus]